MAWLPLALLLAVFTLSRADAEDADSVIARLHEGRLALQSYQADVIFTRGERQEFASVSGDFLSGTFRMDVLRKPVLASGERSMSGRDEYSLFIEPSTTSTFHLIEPGDAKLVIRGRRLPELRIPVPDVRLIGIRTLDGDHDPDEMAAFWERSIAPLEKQLLLTDGDVVTLGIEARFRHAKGFASMVTLLDVDTGRGFVPVTCSTHLATTLADVLAKPKEARDSGAKYIISTSWAEDSGVWLPLKSDIVHSPGTSDSSTESVEFKWISVNDEIPKTVFDSRSVAVAGTRVYDARQDPIVLVEIIGKSEAVEGAGGFLPPGYARWLLILMGALLSVAAAIAFWRRSAKK